MCSLTYEEWVWVHKWMSLSFSLSLYFSLYSCVCVCLCMCAHKTIQHLYSIVSINFFVFFFRWAFAFEQYCMWSLWVHSPHWLLNLLSNAETAHTKIRSVFSSSDFFDRKWIRDQRQHIFSLSFEIFCMGRNWLSMSILCDLTNNMGQWSDLKMFLSFFSFGLFFTLCHCLAS